MQGENDIRVPRGQAQQVTDALKAKGNVADVVFYPAEGHGFAKTRKPGRRAHPDDRVVRYLSEAEAIAAYRAAGIESAKIPGLANTVPPP